MNTTPSRTFAGGETAGSKPLRLLAAGAIALGCWLAPAVAPAADRAWLGAGGDVNWATAANWDALPVNGDVLKFSTALNPINTNNLLSTVGKVDLNAGDWQIYGDPVALIGSLGTYTSASGLDLWAVPTTLTSWHIVQCSTAIRSLTLDNLTVPGGATVTFYSGGGAYVVNTLNGSAPANVNGLLGGWADYSDVISGNDWGFATWNGANVVRATPTYTNLTTDFAAALPTDNGFANSTTNINVTSDLTLNSLLAYRGLNVNNGSKLTLGSGGLVMGFSALVLQTTNGALGRLTTGLPSGELFLTTPRAYNFTGGAVATLLNITDNGATPLKLVKSGPGGVRLTNNTYTGGTIVNAGRLQADGVNAFGTGPVANRLFYSAGGTGTRQSGQAWLAAAGTYTNAFTVIGPGPSADGPFGAIRMGTNAVLTGPVTLAGNSSIGGVGTVSGRISDLGNGYRLEKPGAGTLTLSASNAYSGGTLVSGGALQLSTNYAVGTGPVTLTNNAQLILNATNALGLATLTAGSSGTVLATQPYYLSGGTIYLPTLVGLIAGTPIDQSFLGLVNPASLGSVLLAVTSANSLDFTSYPNLALGATTNVVYSGTLTPAGGRYLLGGGFLAPYTGSASSTNTGLTITTLTGANSVVVGRPGLVTFTAADTYTGKTTITNAGWVNLTGDHLGQAPATLVADDVTLNGGGLIIRSNLGTINFSANRGLTLGASGGELNIWTNTTVVLNAPLSGSGRLLKTQNGSLRLNADNSGFTGPIAIGSLVGGGNLIVGSATALGLAPVVNFLGGSRITLNGFNYALADLTSANAGNIENGAANNVTLSVSCPTNSTFGGVLTNSISGTAGTLTLDFKGPGTLTLSGRNNHTGGTIVEGGTLALSANGNPTGGLRGSVTVLTNATLRSQNTDTLGYVPASAVTNILLDGGALVHSSGSRLSLAGATLTLRGGSVALTNFAAATALSLTNGTTVTTLASTVASTITTPSLLVGQSNLLFTVADGAAGDDLIVNAPIAEAIVGTTLTKAGPGRMVLNQVDPFVPYSGATLIAGGTLALGPAASLNASPLITVAGGAALDVTALGGDWFLNAGQTLSGGGSVAGSLYVLGTLSPGSRIGTLTVGATTIYRATVVYEVASATNAAGRDGLIVNGTLTTADRNTIQLVSMANDTTPGLVPDFNPAAPYSWTVAIATGGIQSFDPANFTVDTSAFGNPLMGGFTVATNGNALVLNYVPSVVAGTVTGIQRRGDGNFVVTGSGTPGATYRLEAATNLVAPIFWSTADSSLAGGGGLFTLTDLLSTNYPVRFYRIAIP